MTLGVLTGGFREIRLRSRREQLTQPTGLLARQRRRGVDQPCDVSLKPAAGGVLLGVDVGACCERVHTY